MQICTFPHNMASKQFKAKTVFAVDKEIIANCLDSLDTQFGIKHTRKLMALYYNYFGLNLF